MSCCVCAQPGAGYNCVYTITETTGETTTYTLRCSYDCDYTGPLVMGHRTQSDVPETAVLCVVCPRCATEKAHQTYEDGTTREMTICGVIRPEHLPRIVFHEQQTSREILTAKLAVRA